ncbi:STM3941 family protein [uncultured Chryseobacterium sp.]|uniref:STM3941 family protein n=1 Tax=uncultured Chryseobacterium sp. TaxID=259322 RepID=UPI0025D23AEA|nr:STM3941 family protein [uncultured Chryseobacterium sp.]
METSEIKSSKTKLLLMMLGSLAFITLGLFFVGNPDNFISAIFKNTIIISIIGFISIIFFSICLIFIIRYFFFKKINLIINEKGIIDNSSYTSVGMISWNDINSINSISISSNKFLIINVKNPHKYINNQTNFKKKLLERTFKTYGSPISISSTILACNFNELETSILKGFNYYKSTNNRV